MRWPGAEKLRGVNRGLHYHFDWAATLIDRLGGSVPSLWDGQSFAPALEEAKDGGREFLVLSQGAWAAQRGVRFRFEKADWLMLRTYHDGFKDFGPVTLFNLSDDPHEQNDLSGSRADIVGRASRLLEDWRTGMNRRSDSDVDPLVTVMKEGGPFHCLGELPAYLERLRSTGREAAADALAGRHPAPPPRRKSLN